jgi:REP element-mobilizing transposase RayT
MRKVKFQTGEYYHIYNRGVDKRNIFMDKKDFVRFLTGMREFNCLEPIESLYRLNQIRKKESKTLRFLKNRSVLDSSTPLVKIITYCLIPNHYHFLLKQLSKGGLSKFLLKLGQGYTLYFNKKHNRSGSLFQSTFKSIHIKSDGHLMRLSCYINGNAEIHKISKAENWPWSSYLDYLNKRKGTLCNKKIILNQFNNIDEYKNLVNTIIKESREQKDEIKKYLLE